jgi:hypothetical protein
MSSLAGRASVSLSPGPSGRGAGQGHEFVAAAGRAAPSERRLPRHGDHMRPAARADATALREQMTHRGCCPCRQHRHSQVIGPRAASVLPLLVLSATWRVVPLRPGETKRPPHRSQGRDGQNGFDAKHLPRDLQAARDRGPLRPRASDRMGADAPRGPRAARRIRHPSEASGGGDRGSAPQWSHRGVAQLELARRERAS